MASRGWSAWRVMLAAGATWLAACCVSCRWTKVIDGRVTDYDTGAPLPGVTVFANQSGWGMGAGGGYIVWDKEYRSHAESGPTGAFVLRYQVGHVARIAVDLEGYNRYRGYAEPGAHVAIRLKRLPPPHARLSGGQLRFGVTTHGIRYGWAFDRGAIASSCAEADVVPERVDDDLRGPIVIRACGDGGLYFVPAESLGVQGDFLVYADTAPAQGYGKRLQLDFAGRGGLVFVRTRDGAHYAKFEFTPMAFGSFLDHDAKRDAAFGYVYDPGGSRYLPYEIPPAVP